MRRLAPRWTKRIEFNKSVEILAGRFAVVSCQTANAVFGRRFAQSSCLSIRYARQTTKLENGCEGNFPDYALGAEVIVFLERHFLLLR